MLTLHRADPPSKVILGPYLLLALAAACWASGWVIGRGFRSEIPPMAMSFYRWVCAAAILLPFAAPHLVRDFSVIRRHWRPLLILGLLGAGLHNALSYLALNYTTATNGVILNSFTPVLIVVFAWLTFRERLTFSQLVGVVVSMIGVVTVLAQGSAQVLLAIRVNVGDLLVLVSMSMWALYTVFLRWRPDRLHSLSFTFIVALVGALAMVPLWLGEVARHRQVDWSASVVMAIFSLGSVSSVLPYLFWHRGVEQVGPNVAGLFSHLVPIFGVIMAWLFLGEQLHWYHLLGFALIITGIGIASRPAPSVASEAAKEP